MKKNLKIETKIIYCSVKTKKQTEQFDYYSFIFVKVKGIYI